MEGWRGAWRNRVRNEVIEGAICVDGEAERIVRV